MRDCAEDGSLDGEYSNEELRDGERRVPADLDAYSDCSAQMRAAMGPSVGASSNDRDDDDSGASDAGGSTSGGSDDGSGAGAGSGSGAGDGSSNGDADDAEAKDARRQLARADTEQELGDRAFDPRSGAAVNSGDTSNGLPLPVLGALLALTLLLAAGAAFAVHRRNPAFMGALRRVPRPRRRR